ncbi:MAG TPA: membrane protein insertase YidC [Tepidisphaeraceae bacterium]|nr:membrane protein insertase YidC [Tepidisphaeraceae bacterium]
MKSDTKRLIVGMLVAFGVLMGWNLFMKWQWPEWYAKEHGPKQEQPQQPVAPAPTTATSRGTPATTGTTGGGQATPGTTGTPGTVTAAGWVARGVAAGHAPPAARVLGKEVANDPTYAMGVRVVPRGAAVDRVVLNSFDKSADDRKARFTFEEPFGAGTGNPVAETRTLMSRTVSIAGQRVDLGAVDWREERADDKSVVYAVDVFDGAGDKAAKVATVYKTFALTARADASQGYILNVTQRVENLQADKAVNVWAVVNGVGTPPRELEQRPDQAVIGAFHVEGGTAKLHQWLISSDFGPNGFTSKAWTQEDEKNTTAEKRRPALWIGQQSSYFNSIVRPIPADNAPRDADWVQHFGGDLINPTAIPDHFWVMTNVMTKDLPVAGGQAREFAFEAYFGPKGRKVLKNDFYAAAPRFYDQTLVISGGLCAVCTWSWLINGLVWLLGIFEWATKDWGVAIILLVVLVRALLHPITKKSQVHMMKMQKMGPELEKLKKRFADDKEALAKAQMQFYKEQGMGPILGCLPMFLQMPIWIALWNALQSTFELRAEPFLYGLTWIKDLAQPDKLIRFDQPVNLFFFQLNALNILPLLLGVVFYLQSKLQPKPPTMSKEQESQQKMMIWMSTLLFPLFLYTGPSGLNLYILTSTAFGIVESKVIRKHIKEREAAEAARGPVIVDGPPDEMGGGVRRVGGPKGGKGGGAAEPGKKKGWLQRLQEKAEELQKQQQQQKRKGK